MAEETVDIRRVVDEQPFGRVQLLVAGVCAMLVFLDGFDAQAMGYVAPALSADLHISRAALGPVISSALLGMLIGALVCGPLADRVGRKPVLIACTWVFGIGALLTATAQSLEALLAFRLVTGVGLGGVMPNAIALTAEYAPRRYRSTTVTTMFAGFSLGAAAGGFVAAGLIARFGWQAVFVVGGVLPCAAGVLAAAVLPESIRFLVLKDRPRDEIAAALSRIAPDARPSAGARFVGGEEESPDFVVRGLFTDRRAAMTLLLWVMFFMNLLDLYFLNSWLPTVLSDRGIGLETAIVITTLFQIGGTAGALLLGRLIDRWHSFSVLAWTYLAAAVGIVLIGAPGASLALLSSTVAAVGLCVVGGQIGANALSAEVYPTAIRATGVGWALGIGRLGSIVGPVLGGVLVAAGGDPRRVFWAAAVPPLVAAAAAFGAAVVQRRRGR